MGPGDALLAWYDRAGRDLPWRRTRDPYAILVSEVMCQQTQVDRVVPRWEVWMARWPAAAALAQAPRADVLRAWVGLGYNRRAVRLHEAAAVVAGRGWPEDLTELPGVGPYTAAAVGAFAFGRDVVAVDTNVARVCSRLGREPAAFAGSDRPADTAQALMELGALVCRARAAACGACPLAGWCPSRGAVTAPPRRPRGERFEDTDRWVRGRVVAALAAGEGLPEGIAADRLERAVQGLLRDGLVREVGRGLALG